MKTITIKSDPNSLTVGKILCLGRNYAEHAKEMNSKIPTTPILFIKPSSSIIHDGDDIIRPPFSSDMHHEVELVVAIGRDGWRIPESAAFDFVLGYGVGLDMTLRDVQAKAKEAGLPWFVAKGFHTSAPVSEFIPATQITDYKKLQIRCRVNGALRQEVTADKMIFSIPKMIAYISTVVSLERGDLIYTGTPEGVGSVNDGDIIEAELVGYTKITHTIRIGRT